MMRHVAYSAIVALAFLILPSAQAEAANCNEAEREWDDGDIIIVCDGLHIARVYEKLVDGFWDVRCITNGQVPKDSYDKKSAAERAALRYCEGL